MGEDESHGWNVSGVTPGGISSWQPLTIRETLILIVAIGSAIFQWAQLSSQMSMVQHDVASLHTDVSAFAVTLRDHIASPAHAIELERMTIINGRLDDLTARIKSLEAGANGHHGG